MTFRQFSIPAFAGLWLACATSLWAQEKYVPERAEMVETIQTLASRHSLYTGTNQIDKRVLDVMGRVPRHEFVPFLRRGSAYENRPLPIGHGQTISQPYIVALMTDLLELEPDHKVLEIGTGSGYQAAVLAGLVKEVYSIEIIEPLGEQAAETLERTGIKNVKTRIGDGYYGWPGASPFDGIIVTAAAGSIPPPLIEQLKPGGRMVIPVGSPFRAQQLVLVTRDGEGKIRTRQILPVKFVPLTGDH